MQIFASDKMYKVITACRVEWRSQQDSESGLASLIHQHHAVQNTLEKLEPFSYIAGYEVLMIYY